MTDPHDIASDLPAPREDEPESLRSDIIDELADHLQCAAAREQFLAAAAHEPADPPLYNEIRDRVLARFGNPAAVARRLWWDAMQETVMGQRFSLVMQGLMAAAVVMMCVFVWRMITDNARTQAALIAQLQQAQSELLNSQRESNALLAERLSALAVPSGDPIENSDWLPLSFRLVDEAGSPVAGSISISTEAGDVGRVRESLTADANGNVDFGLLPPNWYIWTATAADIGESASATILLGPGRTDRFEIVCPTAPPEPVDLTVQIEMPQAYAEDPIYHVLRLSFSRRQFAGRQWNAPREHRMILVSREGELLGEVDDAALRSVETSPSGLTSTSRYNNFVPDLSLSPLRPIPGYALDAAALLYLRRGEAPEDAEYPLRLVSSSPFELATEVDDAGTSTAIALAPTTYWMMLRSALENEGYREPVSRSRSTRPGVNRSDSFDFPGTRPPE